MTSQFGDTLLLIVSDIENLEFGCTKKEGFSSVRIPKRGRRIGETHVELIRSRFVSLVQSPSLVESAPEKDSC